MYTLDGRLRFQINLSPQDEMRFINYRLLEVVLSGAAQQFSLSFSFNEESSQSSSLPSVEEWPQYVVFHQSEEGTKVMDSQLQTQKMNITKDTSTQSGASL